jgi:tyrosine decarboxylase/aspartate 1-decarboxylase
MRERGLSKKTIIAQLRRIHEKDSRYEDGRVLCSMCTSPLSVAKFAHQLFICSNLGDPGLFPGSRGLEKDVIETLTVLLHGKGSEGFIVSGGTEANLLAMLVARNKANVNAPEVIIPESAHFSFAKICNLLRIKLVLAKLNNDFRADASSIEKQLNSNTVAIVGTAGTAELGAVDPIEELSTLAIKRDVYFHVDAAFGGLVIPFLKDLGYELPEFDFGLDGVNSITIDPHKMGMATIPAGGILFRNRMLLDFAKTETPYLTEQSQFTFVGTRSGAPVAATWAAFEWLGREGFRKIIKRCKKLTEQLAFDLESNGFELVTQPMLNILAFRSSNSQKTATRLRQRNWLVSYVPRLDCIRLVIMPHMKSTNAQAFIQDLGSAE